jgi:hypothetical protein
MAPLPVLVREATVPILFLEAQHLAAVAAVAQKPQLTEQQVAPVAEADPVLGLECHLAALELVALELLGKEIMVVMALEAMPVVVVAEAAQVQSAQMVREITEATAVLEHRPQ